MRATGTFSAIGRGLTTVAKLGFGAAPPRASLTILTEALGAGFGLTSSYAIKYTVQEAIARHAGRAIWASAALALSAGASAVCYLIYANLLPKIIDLVTLKLDREIIQLSNSIPSLEYHERPSFVDKLSLVRQGRQALAGSIRIIGLIGRTAIVLLGAITILATIDVRFLLLPLFAFPRVLAGLHAQRLNKEAQDSYTERQRLSSHIYTIMVSPSAGKEIRVFGLRQVLTDRFLSLSRQVGRERDRARWSGTGWLIMGDLAFTATYLATIGWVAIQAAGGKVSVGDVVLSATMTGTLVGAISGVIVLGESLPTLLLAIERFHWLEDCASEAVSAAGSNNPVASAIARGVEIDGLSFTYPDRKASVLTDVSFNLPAGRVVALVGENGSGKTTLAKLLCGFYRPTAGRILVDGEDLAEISLKAWRSRVCAVFQDYSNFEFSLHESVGVGELAQLERRDLVTDALGRAGGAALAELQPSGLDAMLGSRWGGMALSGGQWQKLALARALFRQLPLLVVFDEPTAALDAAAEHEMFAKFAEEARSSEAAARVTLLITHRFSTARMADVIAVLEKGQLKELGTHAVLMSKGGVYAELFELQAKSYR